MQSFLRRPDVSTTLPRKKTVSKQTGLQKQILQKSMKSTYSAWQNENPNMKLCFSKFCTLRPSHILPYVKAHLNQCLCEYCENMDLKLKVINQVVQAKNLDCEIRDRYHASDITICPPSDDARKLHKLLCTDCKKFQECGVDAYLQPLDVAAENKVSWQVWGNTTVRGNLRKALLPRSGQFKKLIQEMKSELKILPNHLFQARWRQQKFWEIVKNPAKVSVVCIMDSAENYTCLLQNVVQSAHWAKVQVTIHPVVCFYSCSCGDPDSVRDSVIIVSNDAKHDSHAVAVFVNTVMFCST